MYDVIQIIIQIHYLQINVSFMHHKSLGHTTKSRLHHLAAADICVCVCAHVCSGWGWWYINTVQLYGFAGCLYETGLCGNYAPHLSCSVSAWIFNVRSTAPQKELRGEPWLSLTLSAEWEVTRMDIRSPQHHNLILLKEIQLRKWDGAGANE